MDALGARKIWYANGAGASDEAVSDTALWMVLSVFRNSTRVQLAARSCDAEMFMAAHRVIATISANPRGHVLGIVGLGNISKKLAVKARLALGMVIYYYDMVRASEEEERELGATHQETWHGLLAIADCVTLQTPLNTHTQDLIDGKAFDAMKQGARIVNTARGPIVNEDALVRALKSGKIAAAGLNVHYHEPQVSKELASMENVTMTTHIGGGALDTRINFELNAMKNVLAVVGEDGEFISKPLTPMNRRAFEAAN